MIRSLSPRGAILTGSRPWHPDCHAETPRADSAGRDTCPIPPVRSSRGFLHRRFDDPILTAPSGAGPDWFADLLAAKNRSSLRQPGRSRETRSTKSSTNRYPQHWLCSPTWCRSPPASTTCCDRRWTSRTRHPNRVQHQGFEGGGFAGDPHLRGRPDGPPSSAGGRAHRGVRRHLRRIGAAYGCAVMDFWGSRSSTTRDAGPSTDFIFPRSDMIGWRGRRRTCSGSVMTPGATSFRPPPIRHGCNVDASTSSGHTPISAHGSGGGCAEPAAGLGTRQASPIDTRPACGILLGLADCRHGQGYSR